MLSSSLLLPFISALAVFATANQLPLTSDGTVHTTEAWSYETCGDEADPVQIKSIVVSPDPPKAGANLTVTVVADVQERVEEGAYVDVVVKLGRIKLLSKTFDICEEAAKANTTIECPVEAGEYTVVQTVELPKEIPKAKFSVDVQGYTVEDEDLVCLKLVVSFMSRPFFRLRG